MNGQQLSTVVNAKTCQITEPDRSLLAFLRVGPDEGPQGLLVPIAGRKVRPFGLPPPGSPPLLA